MEQYCCKVRVGHRFGLGVALQAGGSQLHRGGLGGDGVGQVDVQVVDVPHQLLLLLRDCCRKHLQSPTQHHLNTDGVEAPAHLELYLPERFVHI